MTRVFATIALSVILSLPGASAIAESGDSARVESLFIYASSGQVRFRDLVQPSKDSLIAMGEGAAPWLARKLGATDARERLTLADLFAGLGAAAVPYVTPYLDSTGEYFPKNAARCLGRIGDTSATMPLVVHLNNIEYSVRSQVATAIGKIADSRAVEPLLGQLGAEPDGEVRKSIIVALGKIGDPRAGQALVAGFADSAFGVRQTAIMAIGSISPPPVKQVTMTLHKAHGIERHAAIVALGHCDVPEAQGILLDMLQSTDPMVRGFAIEGLSIHGDREVLSTVEDATADDSDPFVMAQLNRYRRRLDAADQ